LRRTTLNIHSATVLSDADRREALEIGADRFIRQPIEPQLVLDMIAECLRERQERARGEA
jgi:DNA-binding response OmpR family regulator